MSEIANFRVWRIFLQQEALGPHHSPEKHFRAIHKPEKSYEYNAYCLKNLINPPPLKTRVCSFNLTNLNSRIPIIQGRFIEWNWKNGSEDFLMPMNYFHYYLYLESAWSFIYLNTLESPLPKKALCQVWLKFARWF